MADDADHLRDLVATVAAAYFSNVHVPQSEIPSVMKTIAESLAEVGGAPTVADAPIEEAGPARPTAAQIRKSITADALTSFEDGKTYKTLKRHLTLRGLTPAQYREKWGLAKDYPMVAPSYSEARSKLAKAAGLGRKAGTPAPRRKRRAS